MIDINDGFNSAHDLFMASRGFDDGDGSDDDGIGSYGRTVAFTDYQLEYRGVDYSVDGVVTIYGDLMEVVIDGLYIDVNDRWEDASNYELLNELAEFLGESREFRVFIIYLDEIGA
jgi:hypothetical protein